MSFIGRMMPIKTAENWCAVCGWRNTAGNCGRDDCPRPDSPEQVLAENAREYALALMRARLDVEAPTNVAIIRAYIKSLESAVLVARENGEAV